MPSKMRKSERKYKKANNDSSDDSDSDYSTTDALEDEAEESTEYTTDSSESEDLDEYETEKKFNPNKFKKTLSKLFPSKYSKNKAKEVEEDESEEEEESEEDTKKKGANHKSKNKKGDKKLKDKDKNKDKKKKNNKKKQEESESESESESEEDQSDTSSISDETNEKNYTILIGLGDEDDFEDEEYKSSEDENECNSDAEKTFMGESYAHIDTPEPELKKKTKKNKDKKKSHKEKKDVSESESQEKEDDIEKEYLELIELKRNFAEQLKKRPNNKILLKSIEECKTDIRQLVKKARSSNAKKYHKLIYKDNQPENEMQYFKKKLSNKDQLTIMRDLKEINKHIYVDKPYRLAILQSKMHPKFKAIAMQKLNILDSMDPSDHEYYKIKNWVDTFMKIPFGVYRSISIKMEDGLEVSNDFMHNAKNTLDNCVYGLNDAKLQIMQMLGQWVVNPNSMGTAIAIHGPPGTGKTSIVKDGISKILGREFAFIALGGGGDSSFLEGHSYTYEGSTWGKIVQILIESKCMNPVIYFDELDKVSDTARGQEIIGILTHLTDTSQNSQFHDKYFSEIDFDLSKCLFIFSYNDEHMVNPILKDRMYRIKTNGYETKDKIVIARNHLLPKIREQVNFKEGEVIIPDETLTYMINNQAITKGESGVRNLKRCLEIIHTKLNLFRLVKKENRLFEKEMDMKVEFPITITKKEVDIFVRDKEALNPSLLAMYV